MEQQLTEAIAAFLRHHESNEDAIQELRHYIRTNLCACSATRARTILHRAWNRAEALAASE